LRGRRKEKPLLKESDRKSLITMLNCAEQMHSAPIITGSRIRAMFAERDLEKGLARMRELDALIAAENARIGRPPKEL
jgi:hypothetical protein